MPQTKLNNDEKERLLEQAKIYGKQSTQPRSNYSKRIDEAAGELALRDPSLLMRHGNLLELACTKVHQDGYSFVKGKSRLKRFATPDEAHKPTRLKISAQIRQIRISSLKEDISSIEQRLHFKLQGEETPAS